MAGVLARAQRRKVMISLQFRPNYAKIVELLLYLAHVRPQADKYQAVKLFYLADREHLNSFGRPITFEHYVALPFGPVASNAMDLIEQDVRTMKAAGIDALPFEVEQKIVDGRTISFLGKPLREVDRDLFSKSDLKVFNDIVERFGNKSFDELFNITHDHEAYKRAWRRRGSARSSPMRYEEMIEDADFRERLVDDIASISMNLN